MENPVLTSMDVDGQHVEFYYGGENNSLSQVTVKDPNGASTELKQQSDGSWRTPDGSPAGNITQLNYYPDGTGRIAINTSNAGLKMYTSNYYDAVAVDEPA